MSFSTPADVANFVPYQASEPPPARAEEFPFYLGTETPFIDPSLDSPDQQRQYLADMLAANDRATPSPFTGTPPWGEYVDPEVYEYVPEAVMAEQYAPLADVEAAANTELLSIVSDAPTEDIPEWTWYNDDQFHGLGVSPGVENLDQPIESGHTQITIADPSAEHGWDAWTGRPPLARVARHENNFPGYSAGVHRAMGDRPIEKMEMPFALLTQQYRDLLLIELKNRGVHNAVVADVPSVPFTEQVSIIDPMALVPEPDIGPEGILPFGHGGLAA